MVEELLPACIALVAEVDVNEGTVARLFGCADLSMESTNLGDTDADWVVFHTCWSLLGSVSDLEHDLVSIERAAHLFLGFTTTCWIAPGEGEYFADQLESLSIADAWADYVRSKQRIGMVGRVFGASHCMDDSIVRQNPIGPILMSCDPTYAHPWVYEDTEGEQL